jgi:AAHS family 4-hydroxybenzoate transporter-like MFS transporter
MEEHLMTDEKSASPTPRERFDWFTVRVLGLLILVLMTDSYDLQAASFAAPTLVKVWNVDPKAFAPLFGAGLAGVFFGAPLFGWFGDRFGRKRAIIATCALYGFFSLVCTLTQNPTQFAWLRFLMGLGFGGALPNVVALATELAPPRRRGMLTALIFIGMPLGGAIPGFVAAEFVPQFGWQIIFIIGGVAPLIFALLIAFALPESPAFLAIRRARATAGAAVQSSVGARITAPIFLKLLSREFRATTLLMWLMFTATLLTIYLVGSWLPLVLTARGISPEDAAVVNAEFGIGGAFAGLAISLVIDRIGLTAVAGLFIMACGSVALVALSDFTVAGLMIVVTFCGFAVVGVQYALNISAGLIYPAEMRSSGVGWALGIGRLGSIGGALMGALIVGGAYAARNLFLVPLVPLALGTVAAYVLMRLRGASMDAETQAYPSTSAE